MNFTLNIDTAIFIAFLVINLIVGLSYSKGVRTIKDYALGGRNFSTGALVSTIVATYASGSGFFIIISKTYSDGLYYVFASSFMALQLIIMATVLVPKMKWCLGATSIAEIMGNLYGNQVRFIVAITGTIGAVGSIAVQYKAFGNIFSYFLGFPSYLAVVTAGTIVTVYSAFGGMRAVTFTDVLQFITFGLAIPLVGILIWNQLYSVEGFSINNALQNPKFNYKEVLNLGNPQLLHMIPLMLYFLIPGMEPAFSQRIIIGSNIKQVKTAFIVSAAILLLVKLSIAWIPFLVFNINDKLIPNQLLSYIVDNYTYPGLKGLIIIGVTALAMSTADSYINASSVLFANDICTPLRIGLKKELILSKAFAFILGIGAIILALSTTDLLSIVLTANSFYMPIATVPILLTILGFRSTTKAVLIGMGAGFITVVMWYMLKIEIDCIVIAMIVNLVFLLGSHYLLKQSGGWVGIEDNSYLSESKKLKRKNLVKLIKSFSQFDFIDFCKKSAPKNELMYMGLGIYCILYTLTTMYSTQVELLKEHGKIILTIYQIMMITGVIMAMYPIWPPRIKKEIVVQVAWNIVIFYMLIFFSCFFAMVSNFGQLQFTVFNLNIVTTAILVGWKLGLGMALIGFYFGTEFYKYYAAIDTLDIAIGSPQFIFMYVLMLVGSTLIIFLKPKEEYQALTEEKNEHLNGRIGAQEKELREAMGIRSRFIRNIQHEYHAPMTGVMSTSETLWHAYDKLPDEQRKKAAYDIFISSLRLKAFDDNITALSKLNRAGYELQSELINLSDLLHDRIELCRKLYEEDKEAREFILSIEEGINIDGDKKYLTQALDNIIINSINYCSQGEVTIELKRTDSEVTITFADEGIGIPPKELDAIFDEFVVSSKTFTPAGGRGIGLAVAKRIIEAHGGKIEAESDGVKGSTFRVILP